MKIFFVALLLLSLSNFPLVAQTGKISGFVYNGSVDSTIISNTDVELLIYSGHNLIDDSTHVERTDAKGRFEFTNLKIDSTLLYYPRSTLSSIIYYGRAVRLTDKMTAMSSDVVVYDTTSSADQIVFQLEHLFIDAEPGKILFREIFIMNNMGNKTYIGTHFDQQDRHYVLEFPLPDGFEDVEILTPETQTWVRIEGRSLYHTELMSPGSRQFSYRFIVPNKNKKWQFSRRILYPLGAVNIFVSNPELTIEGPGVTALGDFSIRGTNYQRYSVAHIMQGMELVFTIKNLPVKGFALSSQSAVLIAVVVLLIVGFGYTFSRKSKS